MIPSGIATWIGWGGYQPNIMPNRLQEAHIPVIDNDECVASFDFNILPIFNQSICTGYIDGGVAICGGDSGSPLLIRSPNNVFIHLGVAYWTVFPCGNGPSAYISTGYFIDWIIEQMDFDSNKIRIAKYDEFL